MKNVLIIKTGDTLAGLLNHWGDFDQFIQRQLANPDLAIQVVNVHRDEPLPEPATLAAVIITGSPAMVTDRAPWSERTADWLRQAAGYPLPILGICYGHQLLAHAFGGVVGNHPHGTEVGSVDIWQTPTARQDPLFSVLPRQFIGHVTHTQSVLTLPPGARLLAHNDYEPHQAFVLGEQIWGVQFHPEFNQEITRHYIVAQQEALERQGRDVPQLYADVQEHPYGQQLLQRFAQLVHQAQ